MSMGICWWLMVGIWLGDLGRHARADLALMLFNFMDRGIYDSFIS
jgi:hypothetical protein